MKNAMPSVYTLMLALTMVPPSLIATVCQLCRRSWCRDCELLHCARHCPQRLAQYQQG